MAAGVDALDGFLRETRNYFGCAGRRLGYRLIGGVPNDQTERS
jgi:hypothetical protein